MASVTLRGLTRRYPGAEGAALSGLDLVIRDGELLVVVGPSGCGKSTALRLIAGLDAPDGGEIRIGDRDVHGVAPQDRDVAMVFQGYALYPHLTAREIMAFPLRMRGVASRERARLVDEAAKTLGIGKLLDRRPGELSGGERQRVAMGRAIVRHPKVFLFDEPLSNLDAALRAELRVELGAMVRRLGTTSLYVTHDQVEAMTLGDRVAVLRGGVLQQIGPPREIYEEPANVFVASFLGTPPINLIELEREDGRLVGPGAVVPVPEAPELPARVTLGIRPEHLIFGEAGAGGHLSGTVAATEPLGPETIVYLEVGGGRTLRARAHGFGAPKRGAEVRLAIDAGARLWFDTATGKRIA